MQIWDAGAEFGAQRAPSYFRNTDVAVLVFDVTDPEPWKELRDCMSKLQEESPEYVQIVLVGSKVDLESERSSQKALEINKFLRECRAVFYCDTSALTGQGIDHLFDEIARLRIDKSEQIPKGVRLDQPNHTGGGCC